MAHSAPGPSFRFGLFCPDPSSLIRPHPPHSQAQPDFATERLIPVAVAVCWSLLPYYTYTGFLDRGKLCLWERNAKTSREEQHLEVNCELATRSRHSQRSLTS